VIHASHSNQTCKLARQLVIAQATNDHELLVMAALAIRLGIPSIHPSRGFVAAGGLVSSGSDLVGADRLMGSYTGRDCGA
jgi:hypothetical protein